MEELMQMKFEVYYTTIFSEEEFVVAYFIFREDAQIYADAMNKTASRHIKYWAASKRIEEEKK